MGQQLKYGPLDDRTVHLCVDMQRMFAEDTPWHTPWMPRVLPFVAAIAEEHAENTILTRFITPPNPDAAPGAWRRYYEKWLAFTSERIDPRLLDLLEPLKSLAPPALILDRDRYSAFSSPLLQNALQSRAINTLVITGAETDVCVLATVLDAVDHGYRVVLPLDALCSGSDASHEALVNLYQRRYSQQIETSTTEDVLSNWIK